MKYGWYREHQYRLPSLCHFCLYTRLVNQSDSIYRTQISYYRYLLCVTGGAAVMSWGLACILRRRALSSPTPCLSIISLTCPTTTANWSIKSRPSRKFTYLIYLRILGNFYIYYEILIVCEGPMFTAFVVNPRPRIYIPTNVCTSICLILIKFILNLLSVKLLPTNQENLATQGHWPTWIHKHECTNDSTVFISYFV